MFVFYSLPIVLLVLYLSIQWKFYQLAWKVRGPVGFPLIGCVELLSPSNMLAYITRLRKSYTSPLTAWLGPICVLYIADPENVQRVLTAPECIHKSIVYDHVTTYIGSGLLISKNPEWSSHRKLLNPAFKPQPLVHFVSIFSAKTKELCDQLQKYSQLQRPLHIDDILQEFTFCISSETILGREISMEYGQSNKIVESYNTLIEAWSKAICNALYFILPIINNRKKIFEALENVKKFIEECVEETSRRFQKVGNESVAPTKCNVITHAVELNKKELFGMDEVLSELNHIVVTSYETTSKAFLHIITLLSVYPEWQEKLNEEIEEKFPDKDAELSFENLQDIPLIDMVIKETLRLLPVVPLEARITNAAFPLFDDVVLPKGTNIVVDIYSMHRDSKYWGADALDFNPYRFLQDEVAQRNPFVYIPFSKGMRNCIGWRYANLAMKVFVIKVFQRFRFTTTLKPDELNVTFNITTKLTQQPIFTIEDRSSQLVPLDFHQ